MLFPQIDPVAFSLGPLSVRWYGLTYLCSFLAAWLLGKYRARRGGTFSPQEVEDLLTWGFFGVILGGRLGYVLFYNFAYYRVHPLDIFYLQHGGMSFHGGMLGVIVFMWIAARRRGKTLFETMDFMAPLVPPGLFSGRIGNFINGELWGRVTDSPLGMVFPDAGNLPRHPSQLYQAALEGVLLFIVLWVFSAKPRPRSAVSALFLIGYGFLRFFVEFFREPDYHLGFVAFNFLSMGQLLCIPMILLGVLLMYLAYRMPERR